MAAQSKTTIACDTEGCRAAFERDCFDPSTARGGALEAGWSFDEYRKDRCPACTEGRGPVTQTHVDSLGFAVAHFSRAGGVSLRGEIKASYAELCAAFGPPARAADTHQSVVEWVLRFSDGTVAAIYDFIAERPTGPIEECQHWHVGGHTSRALLRVVEVLEAVKERN